MANQLKAVDFKYENIEAISQKQFEIHLELYKGYIKKTNEVWNKLDEDAMRKEANAAYSLYRGLKKVKHILLMVSYFTNYIFQILAGKSMYLRVI